MSARRELALFALVVGLLQLVLFGPALLGRRVLSPSDVLFATRSFGGAHSEAYQPLNRLLMDPVLQFEPWIEFNRAMLREGRLPLWNRFAGCGAPHLANGQSAVFDPFMLIAYLGPWPTALAWMAAARLGFAALGMFTLARAWGLGFWGRWFGGLAFSLCGFLTLWLLYPVTNSAVWLPWCLWATERAIARPTIRSLGLVALCVGGTLLGGHVQTSAHVLLATGLYALVKILGSSNEIAIRLRPTAAWIGGVGLGIVLSAIAIVPLGSYLRKSPVWSDRAAEHPSPWTVARPRLLDAACTALPYVYGSQRRGHPNLARALGVHNINESAGGYAGLATLIWLAPLGWKHRRAGDPSHFLAGLGTIGALGAFGFPPVVNILRALPVLDVMDHRRLTLWVAFSLVSLAAIGIDRIDESTTFTSSWRFRWWSGMWVIAGLLLISLSLGIAQWKPFLTERASRHYEAAALATTGDRHAYQARAIAQVEAVVGSMPWYWGLAGAQFLTLSLLATGFRRNALGSSVIKPALWSMTVLEMLLHAHGANPSVPHSAFRPVTSVVSRLRELTEAEGRVIGLGEEWPPNLAMRYGLSDPRNYDSVELRRSLAWLLPVYEPTSRATFSRNRVTWEGIIRARGRLEEAGVRAIVSAQPPPEPLGLPSEPIDAVWLTRLEGRPFASWESNGRPVSLENRSGEITGTVACSRDETLILRETFDPGWSARVDGREVTISSYRDTWIALPVPAGRHAVALRYDPPEVRAALWASSAGLVLALAALCRREGHRFV